MTSKGAAKERADTLVAKAGLAASRTAAQSLIMAGDVYVDDKRVDKPGALYPTSTEFRVAARPRFVSRGGDKLESALHVFERSGLDVTDRVCIDIGASTGGFTDCLLQRGASRVVSVDVGYGQLAAKLRADARVVSKERCNARDLERSDFEFEITLAVVDASFIGLSKLLPAIGRVLSRPGHLVALIKPQFEAGRDAVARGRGVIRDETVRQSAIATVLLEIERSGFRVVASIDSTVHGPKGNVEHFVYARMG